MVKELSWLMVLVGLVMVVFVAIFIIRVCRMQVIRLFNGPDTGSIIATGTLGHERERRQILLGLSVLALLSALILAIGMLYVVRLSGV